MKASTIADDVERLQIAAALQRPPKIPTVRPAKPNRLFALTGSPVKWSDGVSLKLLVVLGQTLSRSGRSLAGARFVVKLPQNISRTLGIPSQCYPGFMVRKVEPNLPQIAAKIRRATFTPPMVATSSSIAAISAVSAASSSLN